MDKKGRRSRSIFRKGSRIKIFMALSTIVACIFIAEFALRATGRLPSNTTEGFFDQYGKSYRLKKNLTKIVNIPSYSYTLYTNSYGFRDEKPGPRKIGPDPYVVFLGDSMTFANGVDYRQSFVGVFGRLAANNNIETINMAVGGHHLLEQQDLFRDFMSEIASYPAKVILCFSSISIDGFDKSYSDILVKKGYLFEQSGWRLAYLRVLLGDSSAFYCFLRDNIRRIQAAHSNNKLLFAQAHLRFYRKGHRLTMPENVAKFEAILKEFDDFIRSLGAVPVYVYLPASPDLKLNDFLSQTGESPDSYDFLLPYRLLETHCRESRIQLINLLPVLKEKYDAGEQLNFMLDAHYNPQANELIGAALYKAVFGEAASHRQVDPPPSK